MGSPIWKEARRQAWADVADILRLKPRRRAVVTLGLVIVVAAASWTFTGVIAVTAAASAAWLVVSGIGLYLWALVNAPAKIAAEKQAELEAVRNLGETASTLALKRTNVALAIDAAERLKATCSTGGEPLPGAAIDEWLDMASELVAELGPEYPARFASEAGLLPLVPNGALTKAQRETWTWLDHRAQRLHEFMRELR